MRPPPHSRFWGRLTVEVLEGREVPAAIPLLPVGIYQPHELTALNGQTLFAATDAARDTELWATDGTAAETRLVKNIVPGGAKRNGPGNPGIQSLTRLNGTAYFWVMDGFSADLWKSDGTPAGTQLVKPLTPSLVNDVPESLTAFHGALYFVADDPGRSGYDSQHPQFGLWRTDGTTAGTVPVKNIGTAPLPAYAKPNDLTVAGDTLFFAADSTGHDDELWKSDGTSAGTVLVKDINPNHATHNDNGLDYLPLPSGPQGLTAVGSTLFFTATDSTHGSQLWKSDGTPAGTVALKAVRPNVDHFTPDTSYAIYSTTLFFTGYDGHSWGLWTSDGTPEGTRQVTDIAPEGFYGSRAGALYFAAYAPADSPSPLGQRPAIWQTDGTAAGTHVVKDAFGDTLRADEFGTFYLRPTDPSEIDGRFYFAADDGRHGEQLWVTDGTRAGTRMVADFNNGLFGSAPRGVLAVGNHLFFVAYNGTQDQLWALPMSGQPEATTAAVSVSTPALDYGRPLTLTATVGAGTAGFPSGLLTFKDGDGTIGTATLDAFGRAALTITTLAPGFHAITAVYAGADGFAASSSSAKSVYVRHAAPTPVPVVAAAAVDLTASTRSATWGQEVVLTAAVRPAAPEATAQPTGSVLFKDGDRVLGLVPIGPSGAVLRVSDLAVGRHAIIATYLGNAGYGKATSAAQAVAVAPAAAAVALHPPVDPAPGHGPLILTATLRPANPNAGPPTGRVYLLDGLIVVASGTVADGAASLSTDRLTRGHHVLKAAYSGDDHFQVSLSQPFALDVA